MCRQSDNRRRHWASCSRLWNRPHWLNKWVFKSRLKQSKLASVCRSVDGRAFHSRGSATEKLLSPKRFRVGGTSQVGMLAERSWRPPCRVWHQAELVSKVDRGLASQKLEDQPDDLEVDALLHRPGQLTQHWCDVVASTSSSHQTCSSVLYRLHPLH